MRIALIFAPLLVVATAQAAEDGWREFSYPEAGFAAEYPSRPKVETRDYHTTQTPDGVVPERVYSVNSGDKDRTIEEAAKNFLSQGRMTHDESAARVDFNYGREIRIEDNAGG